MAQEFWNKNIVLFRNWRGACVGTAFGTCQSSEQAVDEKLVSRQSMRNGPTLEQRGKRSVLGLWAEKACSGWSQDGAECVGKFS